MQDLQIPLMNTRTQSDVVLKGIGMGISTGANIPVTGPLSLSGSLDEFPADGIGKIIKGNATHKRNLVESDFVGTGVVISAAAGSHAGGSISAILWLQKTPQQCDDFFKGCSARQRIDILISTAKRISGLSFATNSPVGAVTYLASHTACAGFCTGMELSTDILHASVTAQYFMFQKV